MKADVLALKDVNYERRGLKYDPELLYLGAMFHDVGLTETYSSADLRFEVDGANAAREFIKSYGVPERDIEDVWTAIALHTTPGIPEHMDQNSRTSFADKRPLGPFTVAEDTGCRQSYRFTQIPPAESWRDIGQG